MVEGDGRWDWTRLQFVFSENGLQRLGVTVPPNNNDEDDRLCWRAVKTRSANIQPSKLTEFISLSLKDWILINISRPEYFPIWCLWLVDKVSSAECLFRKGLDSISRGGVGIRWEVPKWESIKGFARCWKLSFGGGGVAFEGVKLACEKGIKNIYIETVNLMSGHT
ncbi:hypothetical protein GOBAR_AA25939 [Gossypium barbadense]|uniref:Uncharacterized protein n=1 Tax=Gossypium barbadense TaxID=3634 RepID=A0A2P5WUI6_GOSBA|nr:hypothetical protein GOBAR_AA25939 [Gossypium barbadense]